MKAEHLGWCGIIAIAAVVDVLAERTMSQAFREASRHPVAGPALILVWGTLNAHLFGLLPDRYDPFRAWPTAVNARFRTRCTVFDSSILPAEIPNLDGPV